MIGRTSYARQSVVYVVENKCFPPSGDGSYGINHNLGVEDVSQKKVALPHCYFCFALPK
jgi:hypothetical protein